MSANRDMAVSSFKDNGEALVNPGMGFTHYEYSNQPEIYGSKLALADPLADWPGLSTVYLRLPWGLLEPEEGVFDWSWFDGPAQRWISHGKRICIRMTTSESWFRHATPDWVFAAGAKPVPFLPKFKDKYTGGPSFEPDYSDPIYLEKLNHFLSAAAARYDGDPNVDFIDIGSFGMWGEGHTWHGSNTHYPYETLFKHIELHAKHFKRTRLVVNDNHLDQDYANPEMIQFCLERRMGIRNDSVCCLGKIPYREVTLHMMRAFWLTAPVVIETGHYGQTKDVMKCWDSNYMLQSLRDLHASYCSIHWWPREFLESERAAIDEANRFLGYRLLLKETKWPSKIMAGEAWPFSAKWDNAGVAPMHEDAWPALTLKAADGGIASVIVDEKCNLRRVLPGCMGGSSPNRYVQEFQVWQAPQLKAAVHAPEEAHGVSIKDAADCGLRSGVLKPGIYELFVSVGTRMGTPRIAMPIDGGDGQRRYRIGRIELVGNP